MAMAFDYGIEIEPDPSVMDAIQRELDEIADHVSENDPDDRWSIANMKEKYDNFLDARDLPFVTIDPLTCKDMDDAVCVVKNPDGSYTEYVAISLISEYIKPGGAIFQEALRRGNSTYFADMVAPMLKEKLSNGIGSLNPSEDRLSLITKIEYDKNGNIISETVQPGVIKSRHKFAYEDVDKIFAGDQEERAKHSEEVLKSIDALHELENIIRPIREANGSTDFITSEFTYRLNKARNAVLEAFADNDTEAHKSIETAMLTANEVFARYAEEHNIPIIYRVEPTIEPESIDKITAILASMGVPFEIGEEVSNYGDLQVAINKAVKYAESEKGKLFAQVVSESIIKCLPQAAYSVDNTGHFALNFEAYAHSTSPIRRLADLVNHMQVTAHMAGKELPFTEDQLRDICEQINKTERNSAKLEMDASSFLNACFVKQKMDKGVDLSGFGIISRVERDRITVATENGKMIIELADCEANSPFRLDPGQCSITNSITKQTFKIGQSLRVKPIDVNIDTCEVIAEIVRTKGLEEKGTSYAEEAHAFFSARPSEKHPAAVVPNDEGAPFEGPVTIHEHTLKSDGNISFEEFLKYAEKNNYVLAAPADHHYITLKYLNSKFGITRQDFKSHAYITLDLSRLGKEFEGKTLRYVNVCEFTTRDEEVLNIKGNNAKYHFLIVSPQLTSESSPFMQLLTLKRQNDIDCDLAFIEYLFRYKGVKYPSEQVNKYRAQLKAHDGESLQISREMSVDFFRKNKDLLDQLGLKLSMVKKLYNNFPTIKRLNVPVNILMSAAHASGAIVLMAHPAKNLRRVDDFQLAIEKLLKRGIDGFNIREHEDREINQQIKVACLRTSTLNKPILDAGGNDCHTLDDYEGADVLRFSTDKCKNFIKALEQLEYARQQGLTTNRQYDNINLEEVEKFIRETKATFQNGLDYFEAFRQNADAIFKLEHLKEQLEAGLIRSDKYDSKFILKKFFKESVPKEVHAYLKSHKTVSLKTIAEMQAGTFVSPVSTGSTRSAKRNMVSKPAQGFHDRDYNK